MRSARAAVDSRCATTIVGAAVHQASPSRARRACSVPGSRFDVASSRTSTDGSASAARASETSWRSPADSREPRSRTSVSRPSGKAREPVEQPEHARARPRRRRRSPRAGRRARCRAAFPRTGSPPAARRRSRSRSELERRVAQVDAADPHRALDRVVEAGDQLGERRLPRAGRTDEREPLARRDVQRHVVQHRLVRAVRERDVVDVDLAVRGQVDRARPLP